MIPDYPTITLDFSNMEIFHICKTMVEMPEEYLRDVEAITQLQAAIGSATPEEAAAAFEKRMVSGIRMAKEVTGTEEAIVVFVGPMAPLMGDLAAVPVQDASEAFAWPYVAFTRPTWEALEESVAPKILGVMFVDIVALPREEATND